MCRLVDREVSKKKKEKKNKKGVKTFKQKTNLLKHFSISEFQNSMHFILYWFLRHAMSSQTSSAYRLSDIKLSIWYNAQRTTHNAQYTHT